MYTIAIDKPKDLSGRRVRGELTKLIKSGAATIDISLDMAFLCDRPDLLVDQFKVLKNRISFEIKFKQ